MYLGMHVLGSSHVDCLGTNVRFGISQCLVYPSVWYIPVLQLHNRVTQVERRKRGLVEQCSQDKQITTKQGELSDRVGMERQADRLYIELLRN